MLAEKLGMPVNALRETLSNAEYVEWGIYLGREAQARQLAEARARMK